MGWYSALSAIKYFQLFVKKFEQEGKLPDKIDDDAEDAFLAAQFGLARW